MSLKVIRVDVPFGTTFGVAMNRMRSWLDENKIQPANFRPVEGQRLAFELTFRSEIDAYRFQDQFTGELNIQADAHSI